ncbi:MAG: T9SS type A sorting domain-containing protein, partial [Bacteroidota bacterium]|nr:T9SS type A sorting domain-containing protein [Bacteroidota bacterium]
LSGERGNNLQLRVMDLSGRVVESRTAVQPNQSLRIGMSYSPGVYLVQVVQGAQVKTLRLIKSR